MRSKTTDGGSSLSARALIALGGNKRGLRGERVCLCVYMCVFRSVCGAVLPRLQAWRLHYCPARRVNIDGCASCHWVAPPGWPARLRLSSLFKTAALRVTRAWIYKFEPVENVTFTWNMNEKSNKTAEDIKSRRNWMLIVYNGFGKIHLNWLLIMKIIKELWKKHRDPCFINLFYQHTHWCFIGLLFWNVTLGFRSCFLTGSGKTGT